ncbi:MAG TPA: metal transporter [Thermoanaerobaculia bacterium]|nr:metal transporter [Thermoanaerobaculia bacterium]
MTNHPPTSTAARPSAAKLALYGLVPVVLLVALLFVLVRTGALRALHGDAPPVEIVSVERLTLDDHGMTLQVLNDGPDPVRIAQVMVDDAYWQFTQEPAGELGRLGRATLRIPYPWVDGEAHEVVMVSATGVTFAHEIPVAVATPRPNARLVSLFALVGLYVGVLPIALGLLWYPLVRTISQGALDFVLALTVGLLLFLLVDTAHEGLEVASGIASSYQGVALFTFCAIFAFAAVEVLGAWLRGRRQQVSAAWVTALLVAIGIGLHNFGEGLAIGTAVRLGEISLGTLLIVGFMLHNTTEGLAIVAPLSKEPLRIGRLLGLGLVAGAPTIPGAWLGGFLYSGFWSAVFLAIAAGAIAQVVVEITRGVVAGRPLADLVRSAPVVAGLAAGFGVMYLTGMWIG